MKVALMKHLHVSMLIHFIYAAVFEKKRSTQNLKPSVIDLAKRKLPVSKQYKC